ncbi:helix-turn-helix domain-containing GNAT family N-acetyltransferase [uncultured Chitinophaga sp.]|uniref:bifunctional helix-turn-helix transcriptional regulator/GNAT family N-acetyltransferase n=1 Tax=uncultured Chitinophaga sp. TaxID=339340 RepID=UPI002605CEE4|nr:helix-turn-helix domain-containing GNAT family N-acetyltransferase [uncultured Chitinophaga sp.]
MPDQEIIADIRQFNRFYTAQLGLLQQHIFDSEYSLTEVRALYEIHFNKQTTATGIREALHIDAGYLSRILRKLEKAGMVLKHPLPEDGRSSYLTLSDRGRRLMVKMGTLSDDQIRDMLSHLPPNDHQTIAASMRELRRLLGAPGSGITMEQVEIRSDIRPGDIGDIIALHGQLYAKEYGYDHRFEHYVMETIHDYMVHADPRRDRLWLATSLGRLVGVVAIQHREGRQAQLRWFLIRPEYRGIGLGKALMQQAMDFCRAQRFRKIYLLTTDQQSAAAALYKKWGFVKKESTPASLWGHDLYEERYELEL